MTTRPPMRAPLGRVRIKTSERKRRATNPGRWRPADAPSNVEAPRGEDFVDETARPTFYPFPLNDDHDH